jgi:hypothetical protein
MSIASALSSVMQPLDVVNELDVRLSVLTPGTDVASGETLPCLDLLESFPYAFRSGIGYSLRQSLDGTGVDGFIRRFNGQFQITPGGLQACIRFSLPSPVDLDHSLDEVPVRKFLSLGTQLADRLRLGERLPHCAFVRFSNPNKNRTNVARVQGFSSQFHDWPVHSVAMSVSSLRSPRNTQQQGRNHREPDDPYFLHDLILNLPSE